MLTGRLAVSGFGKDFCLVVVLIGGLDMEVSFFKNIREYVFLCWIIVRNICYKVIRYGGRRTWEGVAGVK